jgi:hypothetical protein
LTSSGRISPLVITGEQAIEARPQALDSLVVDEPLFDD